MPNPLPTEEERIDVFISYSKKDRSAAQQLSRLLEEHGLFVWWDTKLVPGDRFRSVIEAKLLAAKKVIVLWSPRSVESDFVTDEADLARANGKLIPIKIGQCDIPLGLRNYHFLMVEKRNFRPHLEIILRVIGATPLPGSKKSYGLSQTPRLSVGRLPATFAERLFGREDELNDLFQAWDEGATNVIVIDALGGAGKTALLFHFYQRLLASGWRGAEAVYIWSFYTQGTDDDKPSRDAEDFFKDALDWFGYKGRPLDKPRDKGVKLAELIRNTRTVLILDGLEPLQYAAGKRGGAAGSGLAGQLKDKGLEALIKELASHNRGICVITTRQPLPELRPFREPEVLRRPLRPLGPAAGADLLKHLGVRGKDSELQATVAEFKGHALALTLLGRYLASAHGGDVRLRDRVPSIATLGDVEDRDPFRVMHRYVVHFEEQIREQVERGQKAADTAAAKQLGLLYVTGLFDRPTERGALNALLVPPIGGLTDVLADATEPSITFAVDGLRQLGLLSPANPSRSDEIDTHPLVREFFGAVLQDQNADAWRAGHARLFDYYANAAEAFPLTLDAMQPLFLAVHHGCRAGLPRRAFDEIYDRRIDRGSEHYSTDKLGAFAADLAALAEFFDRPWDAATVRLPDARKHYLLNMVGMRLRALGRLKEAEGLFRGAMDIRIQMNRLGNASQSAGLLSETLLLRGMIADAVQLAREGLALAEADWSEEYYRRLNIMGRLSVLGDALHQAGGLEEAAAQFKRMLATHEDIRGTHVYSLMGCRYVDFLLTVGEHSAAKDHAERALNFERRPGGERNPLIIGLTKLLIGRAAVALEDMDAGASELETAVGMLRDAGSEPYVARALIARADLYGAAGNLAQARGDVVEAHEIADHADMQLLIADAHLAAARIDLAEVRSMALPDVGWIERVFRGKPQQVRAWEALRDTASVHLERAVAIIDKTAYGRRRSEVATLRSRLKEA